MIIKQSALMSARLREHVVEKYSTKAASIAGRDTAFLSHSHLDRQLAEGLKTYLKERGWNVYIDWLDESMPDKVSSATAVKLKEKIRECDLFLFLATYNSCKLSRWCPWEIGIADGEKGTGKIIIIPTRDDNGHEYGNEYLGIYRKITEEYNLAGGEFAPAVVPVQGTPLFLKQFRASR